MPVHIENVLAFYIIHGILWVASLDDSNEYLAQFENRSKTPELAQTQSDCFEEME